MCTTVYFFLSPDGFPWFLVSTGFFIIAWTAWHLLRILGDNELNSDQKREVLFELHLRLAVAVGLLCLLGWMFHKPWRGPWFFFVFSGAGVLLTIHHSIAFIDWKRIWLFPQLQLYFNMVLTCYVADSFYFPTYSRVWWLWPTAIWGAIILLQLLIFAMITRRRIRLSEMDPEAGKQHLIMSSRVRHIPAEVPLLVDFSKETDTICEATKQDSYLRPPLATRGRTSPRNPIHHSLNAPIPRASKQHLLSAVTPSKPFTPSNDVMDIDGEESPSGPLVEYVSTPVTRLGAAQTQKTPNKPLSRPISMRVVHHDDEHTVELEDDSLSGSEGITIDVVHIPAHQGFG